MESIIPLVFATYYLTTILLLEQKESHEGPFATTRILVAFGDQHVQRFSLFDIPRLLTGAYSYDLTTGWLQVNKTWMSEAWQCPICLSFWIALVLCLLTGNVNTVTVLCVAGGSAFLCVSAEK